ncbi:MAG TPA: hypothetical protein VEA44_10675 [Caulobacter sp.]|nr:hypothetical protein [Caulobacter sp.]
MGTFTLTFERFAEETKAKFHIIGLGIILEVGERLVDRSPWDTGFFRANWRFSLDTPDRTVIDPGGTSENPAPKPGLPDFSGQIAGRVAYWTNAVPYGPVLEEGHSKKAPLGFVRITVMEYLAIVDDVVGRSIGVGGSE